MCGFSEKKHIHILLFSISEQRKEYLEELNKEPDIFQVRVEVRTHLLEDNCNVKLFTFFSTLQHLFTCELDGQQVRTTDDCVAKLMKLDAKGRLWPQEMIMGLNGAYLLLCDIETKVTV